MPFYEFQCKDCQTKYDVRASIKEKEAGLHPECPQCNGIHSHQVISAGLVLHGSDGGSLSMSACGPNAGPGCC
jgi:putative FmdB family regulatory protein